MQQQQQGHQPCVLSIGAGFCTEDICACYHLGMWQSLHSTTYEWKNFSAHSTFDKRSKCQMQICGKVNVQILITKVNKNKVNNNKQVISGSNPAGPQLPSNAVSSSFRSLKQYSHSNKFVSWNLYMSNANFGKISHIPIIIIILVKKQHYHQQQCRPTKHKLKKLSLETKSTTLAQSSEQTTM